MRKLIYFLIYAAVLAGISAAFGFFYFSRGLPTIEQISSRQISQSTKIYDRTGEVLLYEISSGQERTVVPLEKIPKYLKDATIAIEDRRFYEEPGFDLRGIARAAWVNLQSGNPLQGQGASTITQQLARNAFLTPERTVARKVRELILATRIDSYYSKDEILELYLNEIPYGPTLYGVESASRAYFNKPVEDLNLAESAILATLPKAPTYYSPWGSHVKELLGRQKLTLEKMLETGKISEEEFDVAIKMRLEFAQRDRGIKAPHFVLAVRDYLVQKYGDGLVREGGLKVRTTLDWNLQQLAERVVKEGAEENDRLYNGKNAALVAQNPKSGGILALVGSRDYFATSSLPEECSPGTNCQFEPNFNVATQGLRQPGSSIKPFVYLTAFEKGYIPESVVFDVPTEFTANHPKCPPTPNFEEVNKDCFHPENFDDQFRGPVSMRQALGQSINVPSVKVLYLAGLQDSVKNAYEFGLETLTSPNLYGLSLVLGGGAVRLIDLVGAYSVLAQEGVKQKQTMVLEVRDSTGQILESHKSAGDRVADPQHVRMVNNILSDTITRSGLFQNSLSLTVFPDHDVALKTGTSNDYRDAWAIGYTPSIVVGIWAGNNDNSPMQERGSSLLAAIPMWHNFMSEAVKELPLETFTRPNPTLEQKPILAGNYMHNKQIHSILYYVDRKNPKGPQPGNPADDPQFNNWEPGVLAWAKENIPDFEEYNKPVAADGASASSTASSSPPRVNVVSPTPGSFVGDEINIIARIEGVSPISNVNVYWNNLQIQGFTVNSGNFYDFRWTITPQNLAPQNLLEIEALDQNNLSTRVGVIVYRR